MLGISLWTWLARVNIPLTTLAGSGLFQETGQGPQEVHRVVDTQIAFTLNTSAHDNSPLQAETPPPHPFKSDRNQIPAATVDIPDYSITGILPVTPASIDHLQEILEPFLSTSLGHAFQEITLVTPGHLAPSVSATLQAISPSNTPLTFSVREKDCDMRDESAYIYPKQGISSPWVLVMGWDGLRSLESQSQRRLLALGHHLLPIGPRGIALNTTTETAASLPPLATPGLHLALYLRPPFVVASSLLPEEEGHFRTWELLGAYFSQCNSFGAGGILHSSTKTVDQGLDSSSKDGLPLAPYRDHGPPIRFTFFLSNTLNVQQLSPLLCQLIFRRHHLHILVVETNMKYSFTSVRRKARLRLDTCRIDFSIVNQFMNRRDLSAHLGDLETDVVVMLEGLELNNHFRSHFIRKGRTVIRLPVEDLMYSDWMSSLSLEEWRNWHRPKIEISVITRDRPQSLARLLKSLTEARYFGDQVALRLNLEQDCDSKTVELAHSLHRNWTQGPLFVHRRTIHAGLLPAVVESWYPSSLDNYGLLLEDDVEVSPLFYAWAKQVILKYRYGEEADRSPSLFGVSLYQQKHIELRKGGRVPFNARSLFSSPELKQHVQDPTTPYLSQVPCSWGAIYFPDHWSEFHSYLALRFSETWIPIDSTTTVVPNVRSNHWSKSWKKFFIEMAYLKGYVMLYPNFEEFESLSTNHLELGSHVKVRSREKKELFELPLMPLPSEAGELTGLSRLPGGRLPSFRDLPVLNLTGAATTLEDIVEIGLARRKKLCFSSSSKEGLGSNDGVRNHGSIHNFICA
ncbi:glycosyltransferase 2 [Coprinopsis cinerea AmutBmut pab1-1]|nr:glycosyltransferase 2 [Coprinopsis cinerea AmutBmut pab1-1]